MDDKTFSGLKTLIDRVSSRIAEEHINMAEDKPECSHILKLSKENELLMYS